MQKLMKLDTKKTNPIKMCHICESHFIMFIHSAIIFFHRSLSYTVNV